jgi:DNA-binding transcriptional MerR regulator
MDHEVGFPLAVAARLAGLTAKTLCNWSDTGFLSASIPAKRRGVSRCYTFRDVVALRVAAELREGGVTLQKLRKVVDYLRARDGLSATEVLARTNLVTKGEEVYEVAGDVTLYEVTLHVPSGQRVMGFYVIPLDQVVSEVQRNVRALRRAA